MTGADVRSVLRAALGPVGIWTALDGVPTPGVLRFAAGVEELGYGALWINEGAGREAFSLLGALAARTERITLGLGAAPIHARDATAARNGGRFLRDLTGGRFVMGLGVSHEASARARGHAYGPPLSAMASYLDAWEAVGTASALPGDPPLVLAALGPRMLELAARRADGAFAFLVTRDQVAEARRRLDAAAQAAAGPPVLIAALPALAGAGPGAVETARGVLRRFTGKPAYRASLGRAGIDRAVVDSLPSPVVESLVAIGDAETLQARVDAMRSAGADHVTIIPIGLDGGLASLETCRILAPGRS